VDFLHPPKGLVTETAYFKSRIRRLGLEKHGARTESASGQERRWHGDLSNRLQNGTEEKKTAEAIGVFEVSLGTFM